MGVGTFDVEDASILELGVAVLVMQMRDLLSCLCLHVVVSALMERAENLVDEIARDAPGDGAMKPIIFREIPAECQLFGIYRWLKLRHSIR